MQKTIKDTRRFIREWSEFFRDIADVTESAAEEFIMTHKRKKYLRQSLERLEARGFIKRDKGSLVPTRKGTKLFLRLAPREGRPSQPAPKRGQLWYVLSFDIPVEHNKKRVALTRLLREYGFVPFQRSVWIGPHKMAPSIWEFIVLEGLADYCAPMIVDIIEGSSRLINQKRSF